MRRLIFVSMMLSASLAYATNSVVLYDGTNIHSKGYYFSTPATNGTPPSGVSLFAGSGTTGTVTSAGGDAGKFLKADATWATPAAGSGGDVYAASNNVFAGSNTFSGTVVHTSNTILQAVTRTGLDNYAGNNATNIGTLTATNATFSGTLTATVAGSVSNSANLGGVAAASYMTNVASPVAGNFLRYDGANWVRSSVSSNTFLNGQMVATLAATNANFDGAWHSYSVTNLVPTQATWIGCYVKAYGSVIQEGLLAAATNVAPWLLIFAEIQAVNVPVDVYGQIFIKNNMIWYYCYPSASNATAQINLSGWGY